MGTYEHIYDDNNWSKNCVPEVKVVLDDAGDDMPEVILRIYDPVDPSHMDFQVQMPLNRLYAGLSHPEIDSGGGWGDSCDAMKPEYDANAECQSVHLGSLYYAAGQQGFSFLGDQGSLDAIFAHKAFSVGASAEVDKNVIVRIMKSKTYTGNYCGGGTNRYGGGSTSAISFVTGGGGIAHLTLCSNGLGMYGPSQCTTSSSYDCYIGGQTCNSPDSSCESDAGQRAAIALKLLPPKAQRSSCKEILVHDGRVSDIEYIWLNGQRQSVVCDGEWTLVANAQSVTDAFLSSGAFGDPLEGRTTQFKMSDAHINALATEEFRVSLNNYDSSNTGPIYFESTCDFDSTMAVSSGSRCRYASHSTGGPYNIVGQVASHRYALNTDVSGVSGVQGYWMANGVSPNYLNRATASMQRLWVR